MMTKKETEREVFEDLSRVEPWSGTPAISLYWLSVILGTRSHDGYRDWTLTLESKNLIRTLETLWGVIRRERIGDPYESVKFHEEKIPSGMIRQLLITPEVFIEDVTAKKKKHPQALITILSLEDIGDAVVLDSNFLPDVKHSVWNEYSPSVRLETAREKHAWAADLTSHSFMIVTNHETLRYNNSISESPKKIGGIKISPMISCGLYIDPNTIGEASLLGVEEVK